VVAARHWHSIALRPPKLEDLANRIRNVQPMAPAESGIAQFAHDVWQSQIW
jgi:hypothetical protein